MQISTPSPSLGQTKATRSPAGTWQARWRVVRQIARQEVLETLYGWPLYAVVALSLLLGSLFVYNALNFVGESGLLIMRRPFYVPLLLVTTLTMLYLAAWATLAIARPRDLGALRVLFFAPVDEVGLVGGLVLAGAVIAAFLALLALPLLLVLALITNLPLPPGLIIGLIFTPFCSVLAVAIGLFLSSIAATSRSAMFFFGAALLLVLAIPAAYSAMLSIPQASRYYDALLFLRNLLRILRDILNWISPFALLGSALDASLRGNWGELLRLIVVSLIGSGVWVILAVGGMRRRGVLP